MLTVTKLLLNFRPKALKGHMTPHLNLNLITIEKFSLIVLYKNALGRKF
jgi:hypothetical protein